MSSIILNQLNGIYRLYADGIITMSDARQGMIEAVLYYMGNIEDYAKYIGELLG